MSFTQLLAEILRDYATDGVPSTGAHKPVKADFRTWGSEVEAAIGALQTAVQTIWVPAERMIPRTTNGAQLVTLELATNDVMLRTLDFDQTTEEGAQFHVAMPKSWNGGTFSFIPYWTATSGSGGVVWNARALLCNNDDALDVAFGGSQDSIDTLIATGDQHIGPESNAITGSGTAGDDTDAIFEIRRITGHASDTLTADAKLIGVKINYNLAP
jgi:hypothetical protein